MSRAASALTLVVFSTALAAQTVTSSSLAGTWSADLSRSSQNPQLPLKSVVLDITVAGDTVTIADHHVYASGKDQKGTHAFLTDGKEHSFDAPALGTTVNLRATWTSPRTLDTIVTKDGKELSRVVYEVSPDGKTMTATRTGAYAQVVVFDRK